MLVAIWKLNKSRQVFQNNREIFPEICLSLWKLFFSWLIWLLDEKREVESGRHSSFPRILRGSFQRVWVTWMVDGDWRCFKAKADWSLESEIETKLLKRSKCILEWLLRKFWWKQKRLELMPECFVQPLLFLKSDIIYVLSLVFYIFFNKVFQFSRRKPQKNHIKFNSKHLQPSFQHVFFFSSLFYDFNLDYFHINSPRIFTPKELKFSSKLVNRHQQVANEILWRESKQLEQTFESPAID
jgi:hypothetical protein